MARLEFQLTYDKASIKGEFEATKHEWKLTKFQHFQEYLRNTSRSIYLGKNNNEVGKQNFKLIVS